MLTILQISSFDLNHGANIVKGYALAFGVAFAVWFVWMWWRRKLKADALEAQVRAKQAFARFTHQVMLQPEIASPVAADASAQRARYQKYVELLVTTADEILLLNPVPQWRAALMRQLAPHGEYLASTAFRDGLLGVLSTETRDLIDRVIAPASGTAQGDNVRPLRTGQG